VSADSVELGLRESYLRRAFFLQTNLILLGGAALFSLASASALPLFVGLGLEAVWLLIGPNLGVVQRLLRRPPSIQPVAPQPERAAPPRPALEPLYANRAALFERVLRDIEEHAQRLDAASQRHVRSRIEFVGRSFSALCESHQRVSKYLAGTLEVTLLEEIARQKRAFSAEKDLALRLAIRQSVVLAERRLEQRGHAEKSLRAAAIRLETFERAAGAVRAQAQALGLTGEVVAELEALCTELGSEAGAEEPPDHFR
jgi:hypothetical protein